MSSGTHFFEFWMLRGARLPGRFAPRSDHPSDQRLQTLVSQRSDSDVGLRGWFCGLLHIKHDQHVVDILDTEGVAQGAAVQCQLKVMLALCFDMHGDVAVERPGGKD